MSAATNEYTAEEHRRFAAEYRDVASRCWGPEKEANLTKAAAHSAAARRLGTECGCESALCDHEGRCLREASEYVQMEYVVDCCDTCAANMCKSPGGEGYIYLVAA